MTDRGVKYDCVDGGDCAGGEEGKLGTAGLK